MKLCPRCNRSVPDLTHRGLCHQCHDIPVTYEFQTVTLTSAARETLEQAALILTSCGDGWNNYAVAIATLIHCAEVREEEPKDYGHSVTIPRADVDPNYHHPNATPGGPQRPVPEPCVEGGGAAEPSHVDQIAMLRTQVGMLIKGQRQASANADLVAEHINAKIGSLVKRVDTIERELAMAHLQIAELPAPLNWRIEALLKRIELLEGEATP